jgi:hypothetical protein
MAHILDNYWNTFKNEAFKDVDKNVDDLSHERRIWFAGAVSVMSYVTQVQDIDMVVGRVGELVRELDEISKREIENAKQALVSTKYEKPDPSVCYDGSAPLPDK